MQEIHEGIRQNIFDAMRIEKIHFSGELNDFDFLSRLYPLGQMESYDSRFSNAAGDIWQHSVANDDYEPNWVFSDGRFNLLKCEDEAFLRFLCETMHPVVRSDPSETAKLVQHFNEQLNRANYELIEDQKIAGRAIYRPEKTDQFHSQILRAVTASQVLESNWMQAEIRRIQASIENDPASAIGTSKDLVESCCKAILTEISGPDAFSKTDDLATLSKKMSRVLGLVPEGIPEEAKGSETIRRILSNLATITKGISELRGLYGTGHGRDGRYIGLEPRHARLAASCAIAFIDFATETYVKKRKSKP